MIEFKDACEVASRHFGMTAASSCIKRAWELSKEWVFEPASRKEHGIAVDKANGALRESLLPYKSRLHGEKALELEVPVIYRA